MGQEQYQGNGIWVNKKYDSNPLQLKPHSKNHHIYNQATPTVLSIPLILPQQTKSINTVIILDFDNTIFPTSKFAEISKRSKKAFEFNLTEQEKSKLIQLSKHTYDMLVKYIEKYSKQNIYIVTLESKNWIKDLFSKIWNIGYYHRIFRLICDPLDKILIYHAKDIGGPSYIERRQKKKYKRISPCLAKGVKQKDKAFVDIFNKNAHKFDNYSISTFVIIGAQWSEYYAAQELRDKLDLKFQSVVGVDDYDILIHRIKLLDNPGIADLAEEQELLREWCCNDDLKMDTLDNQEVNIQFNETI